MKKDFLSSLAASVVLFGMLMVASPSSAATTYSFSDSQFSWYASGGFWNVGATEYHVWTPGDYWNALYTDKGISSITGIELTLDVIEVATWEDSPDVATLYFDVYINDIKVGGFSLATVDLDTLVTVSFAFSEITGDDYDIKLLATGNQAGNELKYGIGSYDISLAGSSVTFAAVPVPSAILLLGAGIIGLAGIRRKKR